MKPSEYIQHDGVGLARLIANRQVSPREVMDAAIAVIEDNNPRLNAVILRDFEAARVERELIGASALEGVPFLLKDVNLYSSDMPTTFGSAYFRGATPKQDSTMVARWRSAGLRILGKTNTPEFAAEFVTEPRAYGTTVNPAAPGLTVGGSSGGAAAAVASGMIPIAHATDLGGSIRIPAACCGVFGFKPTAGLNPVGPHFSEIAGGLNSDHVITRTVRDSAASLDITADRRSHRSDFLDGLQRPLRRLRIGFCETDADGRPSGPDQRAALKQAMNILELLGHELVEYRYPSGLSADDWFDYLWIFDIVELIDERAHELGRAPERTELEPLTWHLLEKAKLGERDSHESARASRQAYNALYLRSFEAIDLLLTPTLATAPPPVGALAFEAFGSVDAWNEAGYRFAPFSIPANISGQPSATCPYFSNSEGLSIGVQINGKPGDDLLVLQLSAQLEQSAAPAVPRQSESS